MNLAGQILAYISGGFLVIFIICFLVTERFRASLSRPAKYRLRLWPLLLCVLFMILSFSILTPEYRPPFVLYMVTIFGILLVFIIALVSALLTIRDRNPSRIFKGYWNMDKAFGGSVFADIANTIALLAGAGAYQITRLSPSWFWVGQFGACLAVLAGVSVALRWTMGTLYRSHRLVTTNPLTDRWFAIGNLAIGCFSLLALMSPVNGNDAFSRNWVLLGMQMGVLALAVILPLVIILVGFYHYPRLYLDRWTWPFWALILLVPLGTVAGLIVFGTLPYNVSAALPATLTDAALAVWIAMEAKGIYDNRSDERKVLRGSLIMLGNLFMFPLVIWVASTEPDTFIGGHWILFTAGLNLPAIATLIGVDLGIENLAHKMQEDDSDNEVEMVDL